MPVQLKKQQIILIVGVTMAVGAVFLAKVYIDKQNELAKQRAIEEFNRRQANQTSVLVANKAIPKGTLINDQTNFDVVIVPNQYALPGAVTGLNRIIGMVTIQPIEKGEQLNLSKLAFAGRTGELSEVTPSGKRAVTISVDNIASLAGMLKAGDFVDVIAMVPLPVQSAEGKTVTQAAVLPIFQNVKVLAVGQETSTAVQRDDLRYAKKEEKKEISPLITLALSPQEANIISFVQEQGKIRLTLRSPSDTSLEPLQPANWDTVLQYLFPRAPTAEIEYKPSDYVEIYRGLNKEKVLLSK